MTILEQVLNEEYERLSTLVGKINEEISQLPKGYISQKNINGHTYAYLQQRVGKKIKSEYIAKDRIDAYMTLISRRKYLEQEKRARCEDLKKIEKALGVKGKNDE